jgi:FkbM family methyltransferase
MSLRSWLRSRLARRLHLPEIPVAMERLARLGFEPEVVFDVGAYRGEFTLLCRRIWPRARLVAFEPLEERAAELRALTAGDPAVTVHQVLLGPRSAEEVELHARETASSVLEERVARGGPVRRCRMRSVDEVVASSGGGAPGLLKLDVQGYELEVLRGAERSLPGMQAILAEVNLLDLHVEVPGFAQFVSWLDERGWTAYDICGLTRRPLDRALWQADMIFVPRESALRTDKRWEL